MKREEADALLHQKVEEGELISPVLPEGVKNYLIDIDGTITSQRLRILLLNLPCT